MPQPTPYGPNFNFTDFQAASPANPLPGFRVDAELAHLEETLVGVLANLALIQRDDGLLRIPDAFMSVLHGVYASDPPFNCIGVGDETVGLTAFFNHAIANPGIPHYLLPITYSFSAPLPAIQKSNVKVKGCGTFIHDVGSDMTGTVLRYIGPALVGRAVELSSPSGGANQVQHSIEFTGIGIDCNGLLSRGIDVCSVWDSKIDVAVNNPTDRGMDLFVAAAMGESQSTERNKIIFRSQHIQTRGGYGMVLRGNAVANVSMNEIWADIVHADAPAIRCENSDNNDWRYLRTFCLADGTATESVSLLANDDAAQSARDERFWALSGNKPIHAYADKLSPSVGSRIFSPDKGNGTPDPIVDAGASFVGLWTDWTPTFTAGAGAFTTITVDRSRYRFVDGTVSVDLEFRIVAKGTATGEIRFTAPLPVAAGSSVAVTGIDTQNGHALTGFYGEDISAFNVWNFDATDPIADNGFYAINFQYEAA